MKTLLAAVMCLAVILGIVSTSLWRALRNERVVFEDVRTQLTEARAASRVIVPPPPVVVSAPAPVPVGAVPDPTPACKPTTPLPTANVVDTNRVAALNRVTERDLLADPEYRKLRLAQRRLDMQRNNPGVADALGLSDKDADRLFDLLAEGQIRMNELPAVSANAANAIAANSNAIDARTALEETARNRQALQKQQDESLVALLGSSGFERWQEYQQTRGARSQAVSLGSQLLQVGLPLSNAQLKPLTAALIAEQQRQRLESPSVVRNEVIADPQARAAAQEEAQRRSAESNRRLLAAIAPTLNPQQLAVFREQFETQEAMNRVSARARERAEAARSRP